MAFKKRKGPFNYSADHVADFQEGDVFKLDGKFYLLEKKLGSNIMVRRYYWFDRLAAAVLRSWGMY